MAQVEQYNLIVVVGARDAAEGVVTLRCRDDATSESVLSTLVSQGIVAADRQSVGDGQVVLTLPQVVTLCGQMVADFK